MKKIVDVKLGRTDVFTVVNEFPKDYIVWNIGRQNFKHDGFLPLARRIGDTHYINLNTLKAIEVESEELALAILKEASRCGVDYRKFVKLTKK